MKIRLGEPQFLSVQGEGLRTGVLSVWTRFFGCSLRCPGFFQKNPMDKKTYIDPLKGINPKEYKSVFDLPVVEVGCDSIYSIDPRFKHCAYDFASEKEAVDALLELLPFGKFVHPKSNQTIDWCLTGGEPLMHQDRIVAMYKEMLEREINPFDGTVPFNIQVETNATRELTDDFVSTIIHSFSETHFSISPKLYSVSGEEPKDAWHPTIIKQYWKNSTKGWLKFVVNDTEEAWAELNHNVEELHDNGVFYPIMIMPVGATYEQQTDSSVISNIANRAIKEGYHVSGRLHTTIWGNGIGT